MKRACAFGLLVMATMILGACQSGAKETAGFNDREGVWFNARGERVHREQLFGGKCSTPPGAADIACREAARKPQCPHALGSRSEVPRMSGYTRDR